MPAEAPLRSGRPAAVSVRVLTWNIRDLLGDPAAVRRVLRSLAPDVACLQEVPRRPGSRVRAALLARDAGLRWVAGGRASGGTAVLVGPRVAVRRVRAFRLPVGGVLTRTRGAVLATVATPDGDLVTLACVHLPLDPGERLRHARLTAAAVRGWPGSLVVAGDLNEPPGGPAWRAWEDLARDPWPAAGATFPAGRADVRADAVLVGSGLEVLEYGDGGADPEDGRRASDHVPVLAVLRPTPG